jgi:hypothetical protein
MAYYSAIRRAHQHSAMKMSTNSIVLCENNSVRKGHMLHDFIYIICADQENPKNQKYLSSCLGQRMGAAVELGKDSLQV